MRGRVGKKGDLLVIGKDCFALLAVTGGWRFFGRRWRASLRMTSFRREEEDGWAAVEAEGEVGAGRGEVGVGGEVEAQLGAADIDANLLGGAAEGFLLDPRTQPGISLATQAG